MIYKAFAIILAIVFVGMSHVDATPGGQLADRYRSWIEEEVVYIISPAEREVFLQLKTDRERELFIQAFWDHRDPTPGDRDNEARREHYSRIAYVEQYFGRDSPQRGWKTDQGRMYIMLGEPNDIQRFEGMAQVHPTELWFYQGLTDRGLPPAFYLVFYQDRGIGEYRLYSPLADGPQALLTSYAGDPLDYLAAYDQLREHAPELSGASLSLLPGEGALQQGRPSMSSDLLVNRIESTPQREVEDRYARKFLEYKDIVEVEYSTNYIESESLVKLWEDASGLQFVHYAIEPERLSVHAQGDRYSTVLTLNGTVTDEDENVIHQFEKTIPLQFDGEQIKSIRSRPVSIRDMLPLIPGQFRLSVLVKNEASKEFATLESRLSIPDEGSALRLTSPLLGYRMRENRPPQGQLRPFQSGRFQVYFQANRLFTQQDMLVLAFQVLGLEEADSTRSEIRYTVFRDQERIREITRRPADYPDLPDITEGIPLQDLPPAHYEIHIQFLVDGREVLRRSEEFGITHAPSLPRPWTYSKLLAAAGHPVYAFIIGSQYFRSGSLAQARTHLETAYVTESGDPLYALSLARVYLAQEEYDRVPPLLSPLLEREGAASFEVFYALGRALQGMGDLARAAEVYEQALKSVGVNTILLNALGECQYRRGRAQAALAAWERSLEIDAEQPAIARLVESIKEKR